MTELQLKFADHCINELFERHPHGINLSMRFDGISYDEGRIVVEILKGEHFVIREGVRSKLTTWGYKIIQEYGLYSNYVQSKNIDKLRSEEKSELEIENLRLSKENSEYLKTIRDQEQRIRDLDEKNKFIELLKNHWWVIGVSIGIGIGLRELWGIIMP